MQFVKIISTEFDELKRTIVKFCRFGKGDIQTAVESSSYGIDSNPLVKDLVGVYATTSEKGQTVLIGYLIKDKIADIGETRLFSQKANGDVSFFVHLKNDGTAEIGGDEDNLVRYSALNTAVQQMKTDINTELVKIAAGIATGGGSYTVAPLSVNLGAAKIEEIKCP